MVSPGLAETSQMYKGFPLNPFISAQVNTEWFFFFFFFSSTEITPL